MSVQARTIQDQYDAPQLPRPLVGVCLAFLCGIVYARFFPCSIFLALIALLILCLSWFTIVRKGLIRPDSAFHWRMVLMLAALVGAVRMESLLQSWDNQLSLVAELSRMGDQEITGTVEETRIYNNQTGIVFLTNVKLAKWNRERILPGKLELRGSANKLGDFYPGDELRTTGRISPIRGPSVPTGFDSQTYRYSLNVFASSYLARDSSISRTEPEGWSPIRGFAYGAMNDIQRKLSQDKSLSSESIKQYTGLIASICYGIKSLTPQEIKASLSRSGLAHLTSISGLHVSMVLVVLMLLLKRMGLTRKQAAWITGAAAIFYVLLVGARIPTLRAVLMTFVILGSYFAERRIDSLNSLALAAIVLLLLYPGELFLPSFQLSFMAVFTLLLISPVNLYILRNFRFRPLQWFMQGCITSAAVITGLAPFTVSYFHLFSWGAIPGNLIAIPVVAFLLPISYAWSFSMMLPFSWLSGLLEQCAVWLCDLLLATINYFSQTVFYYEIPHIPVVCTILFLGALILMSRPKLQLLEIYRIRIRAYHISLALIGSMIWLPMVYANFEPLRIDFAALGQGDCIIIRTPDKRTAIIDGGPSLRNQNPLQTPMLVKYLQSEGIDHIDAMFVTHPQSDHIGTLGDVAQHFPVSMLIEGSRESDIETYKKFEDVIEHNNIPRKLVHRGDYIKLGETTTLWVLHPEEQSSNIKQDVNEQSIVLLLMHRDLEALFTGDIGAKTEKMLCKEFDNWDIDVLKVPHHGSRYASSVEFLEETKPEFAIIQVGRNTYGHPHDEARYRLFDIGAHVLRNDYDGTIQLRYWNNDIRLYATRSNKLYIYKR